jgi:DNA repair exonuclease SbcCD ATPase subunit
MVALATAEGQRAETLKKLDVAIRMADYCVEALGDRGVRSLLVDGVADFVNERVARHLEVLAAGEATTRMSATTDLKKGGARERISFKTEWAWGGSGPDDGSGGQDRREDLAVFASMQDLAESRSARPFPLKAFDEPFDALDSRGKELAAAWVRGIARERGTALLVTHSEELAALAEPDVTWTVVMRKGGATVEVS